jgi:hypothetical protein
VIARKVTLQAMNLPHIQRRNNTLWVLRIALNDSSHPSAASLDRNMPFVFGKAFSYNPATGIEVGQIPTFCIGQ